MLIFFYFCLEIVMKQDDQNTRLGVEGKEQLWTQRGSFSFFFFPFVRLTWTRGWRTYKGCIFFLFCWRDRCDWSAYFATRSRPLIQKTSSFFIFLSGSFRDDDIFKTQGSLETNFSFLPQIKKWKTIKPRCCLHVGVQFNLIWFDFDLIWFISHLLQ